MLSQFLRSTFFPISILLFTSFLAAQEEPPALNPFGPRNKAPAEAQPGYLKMSNGEVIPGKVFLTPGLRLKIFDAKTNRHRQVPLTVVKQIDCKIKKEWLEKEWRFKEAANNEKVYTGRAYPAREYEHIITLKDGRTIEGPVAALVYVQTDKKEKYLLHKRHKGAINTKLNSLIFVQTIRLGDDALKEGEMKLQKAKAKQSRK